MYVITVEQKGVELETRLMLGCESGAEDMLKKLRARDDITIVSVDDLEQPPERDMEEMERVHQLLKLLVH